MRRPLLLGTVWTASAAAAVGLGFLAVSLVDASASPGTAPVAATGSPSADSSAGAAAPTAAVSAAATAEQPTAGGTVFAACPDGQPVLAGVPAEGWWADDSADPGRVEFTSGTQSVEVHAVCTDGSPQFTVEGPRTDDSGGGIATTPSPTTAAASPSVDDSSGRGGGGHGTDD